MSYDVFNTRFAYNIFKDRYSFGGVETWKELCERVVENVCGSYLSQSDKDIIKEYIYQRKFIPAGRYLYASGREVHAVKNCFCFRAEDSREGWANLISKVALTSMLGGGCGVDYSALREKGAHIRKTGGESSGPMALIHAINESARYIRQGGARRAAIGAWLSWDHPDIQEFMVSKQWCDDILKAKESNPEISLPLELTNISVIYNTSFFKALKDRTDPLHKHAREIWSNNCKYAFSSGEPGFSFNHIKDSFTLRNPCVSGDTEILTKNGYEQIENLVDVPIEIWNGNEWSEVTPIITGKNQPMMRVSLSDGRTLNCTDYHKWLVSKDYHGTEERVETRNLKIGDKLAKWTFPRLDLNDNNLCARLKFDKKPQRDASQFARVIKIERIENADTVYCFNEPKNHTGVFNGIMTGQCGEFVSDTDSDSCNLGTIFISKFEDRDDFERCVDYATKFLICGNVYSDYPTSLMRNTALENNRIGLGLGGIHEWLINREYEYFVPAELHKWLNIYKRNSDESAYITAHDLNLNVPKDKRAIAPTGTIGCLAESTTGIEPIFCKAYKRHYYNNKQKRIYEYVIDPVIKKAIERGIDLNVIQDSYDIEFKNRVKVQADIQQYVDMAISSTCNVPEWGNEKNDEKTIKKYSNLLLKYAKRLRGFTIYPNNSRGGQPLERVSIEEALKNTDKIFESKIDTCSGGVCGI